MTPTDGIRKLRQMENSSGIWTMRVQLVIDRKDILIIDKHTMVRGSELRIPEPLFIDWYSDIFHLFNFLFTIDKHTVVRDSQVTIPELLFIDWYSEIIIYFYHN